MIGESIDTQVWREVEWTLPKAWRAALEDWDVDSITGDRSGPPTDPRSESTLSPQAESRKGGLCFHSGGLSLCVTGGGALATGLSTLADPAITIPPHFNSIQSNSGLFIDIFFVTFLFA